MSDELVFRSEYQRPLHATEECFADLMAQTEVLLSGPQVLRDLRAEL